MIDHPHLLQEQLAYGKQAIPNLVKAIASEDYLPSLKTLVRVIHFPQNLSSALNNSIFICSNIEETSFPFSFNCLKKKT